MTEVLALCQTTKLGTSFEQVTICPQARAVLKSCCQRVPPFTGLRAQGSSEGKRLMEKGKMVFSTENAVLY